MCLRPCGSTIQRIGGPTLRIMCPYFLSVFGFAWFFSTNVVADELGELVIEFTHGRPNQPQLKLIEPPGQSSDKLEFTSDGLRLTQIEPGGANAKTAGFSLAALAESAFALILDFDVKQLNAPKAPRVQGMWIRFVFEQGDIPAFGIVAGPRLKRALAVTNKHSDSPKMELQVEPLDFSKGTWLIERQENELKLSIAESEGSFRVAKRLSCPSAPLKEIQISCMRFSSGNTSAEFNFKCVRFVDFSRVEQRVISRPLISYATAKRLVFYGYFLVAMGFVGGYVYRK